MAGRPRVGSRQDAEAQGDGGFRELLLKFVAGEDQVDGAPNAEGEARFRTSSAVELLEWLRSNSEMLRLGHASANDQPLAEQDAGVRLGGIDMDTLLHGLSMGDAAAALAALAGHTGNGSPPHDPAPLQAAGGTADGAKATPEEIILAAIARAAEKVGSEPATPQGQTLNAELTIIGRETHLAPAETVKLATAGSQWAIELATRRSLAALASAATDTASNANVATQSALGEGPALPTGVAAAADAQLGPDGRGGNSPSSDPNAAIELFAETGGPDGVPVIGRANSDLPSGGLVQQIASRVANETSTTVVEAARSAPASFTVKPESAVKVLHLQLQPADLGTVTIRMAVKDNTLRLDLEVGRGETAHLIQRERDTLSALLRSAGYSIDALDIRLAEQTGAGTPGGGGQSGLQMQGGQSGSSQAETRFSGERPRDERRENSFGNQNSGDEDQTGQASGRGGIYL
jgi:chemotaxis protein MotD